MKLLLDFFQHAWAHQVAVPNQNQIRLNIIDDFQDFFIGPAGAEFFSFKNCAHARHIAETEVINEMAIFSQAGGNFTVCTVKMGALLIEAKIRNM